MKPKKRRHSLLITVPVAGIAAAYLWFVFLPGKRAVAALHAEIEEKQVLVAAGPKTTALIHRVEQELQETQAFIEAGRNRAGDSREVAMLYGQIAEILTKAGVVTTRFDPEATVSLALVQKTPLQLGCQGTFAQVAQVLEGLEKLRERVWIDEMSLQQMGQDRKEIECAISLAIFAANPKKSD
jgi:type IV pilus assembly protein PilO